MYNAYSAYRSSFFVRFSDESRNDDGESTADERRDELGPREHDGQCRILYTHVREKRDNQLDGSEIEYAELDHGRRRNAQFLVYEAFAELTDKVGADQHITEISHSDKRGKEQNRRAYPQKKRDERGDDGHRDSHPRAEHNGREGKDGVDARPRDQLPERLGDILHGNEDRE